MKARITDLSLSALTELVRSYGEPDYRARQIFRWLYQRLATSFEEMTDLPAQFRVTLAAEATMLSLHPVHEVTAGDGSTVKILFGLEDGKSVESVLMLAEDSLEGGRRNTVCVSSQVGCQVRCPFCATGQQGFERNLSPGEINEQILYYQRRLATHYYDAVIGDVAPPRLTNIVFMGMGEPLANYESVRQAIENILSKEAMGFGARRLTVSTCGLAPEIRRLAGEPFHVELAISLHAANDSLRDRLVPINRKYPLGVLLAAVAEYFEKTGRRPTFEYILFRGINDSLQHARELAGLLRGLNCHVNLITASPTGSRDFVPPLPAQIRLFQQELERRGISHTLRMSRGLDIEAACGQLHSKRQSGGTVSSQG